VPHYAACGDAASGAVAADDAVDGVGWDDGWDHWEEEEGEGLVLVVGAGGGTERSICTA